MTYSINPITKVLNASPINKQAAFAASQAGCVKVDAGLTAAELRQVKTTLICRHAELLQELGITKPSQLANLKSRINGGGRSRKYPAHKVNELMSICANIHEAERLIASEKPMRIPKSIRRQLGQLENQWRAEHPGAIWDGRQLVAPNGAVFSRVVAIASTPQEAQ